MTRLDIIGELEVSGPSVMLGYDGVLAATARVLREGWLSTGDLGWVDDGGRVFLAGRSKDLIIRAGANIYPAEIDRACYATRMTTLPKCVPLARWA